MLAYILLGLFLNYIIGCIVCAHLDAPKRLNGALIEWLSEDPSKGLMSGLFIQIWPLAIYLYFYYTYKK